MSRKRTAFILLAGVGLTASALPNLTFYEVARWKTFTQTSSAAPATHNQYIFTARVFANTAGEIAHGTFQAPSTLSYSLNPFSSTVIGYQHGGFATEAALNAVYGTGTYEFTLTDGVHAGDSDTLVYGNPGWADQTPYVSNYGDLQNADANQAISIQWNTFTAGGTHTALQTYFTLTDLTTNTVVYSAQGNPGAFTSANFAAGTLAVGHTYRYSLLYGSLEQTVTTGDFAPARATAATYTQTFGQFTTVPEPASLIGVGLGFLALRRRKK